MITKERIKQKVMTAEGKIIKHTILSLAAYLITYTLSAGILFSIVEGVGLFVIIRMLFEIFPFPSMFTGNLLPSAVGLASIYICNKMIDDKLVVMRSRFFTLLSIIGIEVVGTIAYYSYMDSFANASFAIIAILIIDVVKTYKKYQKINNPPATFDESVIDEETNEQAETDKQALLREILSPGLFDESVITLKTKE